MSDVYLDIPPLFVIKQEVSRHVHCQNIPCRSVWYLHEFPRVFHHKMFAVSQFIQLQRTLKQRLNITTLLKPCSQIASNNRLQKTLQKSFYVYLHRDASKCWLWCKRYYYLIHSRVDTNIYDLFSVNDKDISMAFIGYNWPWCQWKQEKNIQRHQTFMNWQNTCIFDAGSLTLRVTSKKM